MENQFDHNMLLFIAIMLHISYFILLLFLVLFIFYIIFSIQSRTSTDVYEAIIFVTCIRRIFFPACK